MPAAGGQHPGRLPRLGRAGRADGRRRQRPRAGGDPASSRSWRDWRDRIGARLRARRRCWRAAAPRGACRANTATPSPHCATRAPRWSWRGPSRRSCGAGRRQSRCTLLFATLVARAAKHLLVLLLAHPLAALLDERTHKDRHATGHDRQAPTFDGPGATVSGAAAGTSSRYLGGERPSGVVQW